MRSERYLQTCGVEDQEWLRAVLEHHEDTEGAGYPGKIKNSSALALLIHDCDVYSAKITMRSYRKGVSAPDAARRIYLEMAHGNMDVFAALLVKEVGMYPPGTSCVWPMGRSAWSGRAIPNRAMRLRWLC